MKNEFELKPFDKVLVRDCPTDVWQIDLFEKDKADVSEYGYKCLCSSWMECVPFEGNEHLLGTTESPERCDSNKNTLFGIKLNPGYVLEFEYGKFGVVFPIREIGFPRRKKLAIIYNSGAWVPFEFIEVTKVIAIKGCAAGCSITSGEVLWKRPQKQSLTKAEIAEKYGMNVKDFEIIDEENEEKE